MTRTELDFRLDQAAERWARLLVGFRRLATTYHATHDEGGTWIGCGHPQCRANVAFHRELTGFSNAPEGERER